MESLINPIQNIRMPKLPSGRDRRLQGDEVVSIAGYKTLHMLKRYTHPKAEDLAKKSG